MDEKGLIQADTPWFKRIKLFRVARGMTQQEVAHKVGVQHRRYWSWEAGTNVPRADHQLKLAEVLGVEHEAIFGGTAQDFAGITRKE